MHRGCIFLRISYSIFFSKTWKFVKTSIFSYDQINLKYCYFNKKNSFQRSCCSTRISRTKKQFRNYNAFGTFVSNETKNKLKINFDPFFKKIYRSENSKLKSLLTPCSKEHWPLGIKMAEMTSKFNFEH